MLAWIAVAIRMWVRFRIVRNAGLDDALVFLAAILNTAASIFVLLCKPSRDPHDARTAEY